MKSINRVMEIISILMAHPEHKLTITELKEETGLAVSTLHRLLTSMIKHRMIVKNDRTKEYGVGSIWLEYGLKLYDSSDYVSDIRPELENLKNKLSENVYLYKFLGDESIIIERLDSPRNGIKVFDQIGMRIRAPEGAANLAAMSLIPRPEAQKVLQNVNNPNEVIQRLEKIAENRIAIVSDSQSENIISMAVPLVNYKNEVIGAIGLKTFILEDNTEIIHFYTKELKNTMNAIFRKLGKEIF